jgi:hypothetical protein
MSEKTLGQILEKTARGFGIQSIASFINDDWDFIAQEVIEAHEARKWQTIESIPNEAPIFLWKVGATITAACFDKNENVFYDADTQSEIDGGWTHWQHMPKTPKGIKNE